MSSIVYIAAPFQHAATAETVAQYLQAESKKRPSARAHVISRWHRVPVGVMSLAEAHLTNMQDLLSADYLIILTYKDCGREVYTELGLHLGRERPVFWLPQEMGECLSLEQNPLVSTFATKEELWNMLQTIV